MISLDSMTPFDPPAFRALELDTAPDLHSTQPPQSTQTPHEQSLSTDTAAGSVTETALANAEPSRVSPWLAAIAYPLGRYGLLPFYFSHIQVTGQEHLPLSGPVILAPTHRSRWDAFLVPYAAGAHVTGRHLQFMVSIDEVRGIQGWFIRRLGGFPVDTRRPAVASLRHGVEIIQQGETLVIFPEGGDLRGNRQCQCNQLQPINTLHPGLARLALQAEASKPNLGVQIVPISIEYSHPAVPWRSRAKVCIGAPLLASGYSGTPKQAARRLTTDLHEALKELAVHCA